MSTNFSPSKISTSTRSPTFTALKPNKSPRLLNLSHIITQLSIKLSAGHQGTHAGAKIKIRPGAPPELFTLLPNPISLNNHTRRQIQLHQRIHRLLRGLENI